MGGYWGEVQGRKVVMLGTRENPFAQLIHSLHETRKYRRFVEDEETDTLRGVKRFGQLAEAIEQEDLELVGEQGEME